jgi:hypothetical protein
MRATLAGSSSPTFTPAVQVVDIPGIRDFDVAHRGDGLLAIVPIGTSVTVPVSVMVDWQSAIPATP